MLGAFYVATPVGAALGFGLGGVLGELAGWRVAFLVLGLPGVLLGLLVLRTQDPPRGGTDRLSRADRSNMIAGVGVKQETQWEVVRILLRNPVYVVAAAGQIASTFGTGGLADWFPTYIQSEFNQGESSSGLGVGAATVVGGVGGSLLGSWLGERCRPHVRKLLLRSGRLGQRGSRRRRAADHRGGAARVSGVRAAGAGAAEPVVLPRPHHRAHRQRCAQQASHAGLRSLHLRSAPPSGTRPRPPSSAPCRTPRTRCPSLQ